MKKNSKIFINITSIFIVSILILSFFTPLYAQELPNLKYQAHIENIGWLDLVSNGEIAGTTGESKRLEALIINLEECGKSMIEYRAHVANLGWQPWVESGKQAGTVNRSFAIEAVEINLINDYFYKYDIYYRVHVPVKGWLGWAKNGETSGSIGMSLRIEAIQIKLVIKGEEFSTSEKPLLTRPTLNYCSHIQEIGWTNYVNEGLISGTIGQSKRMEAVKIKLNDFEENNGILYRSHVSDIGWQNWVTSNNLSGTEGKNKAIEAIEIQLSSSLSGFFDIYYRLHVSQIGWLGWAKNGEIAGTTGGKLQSEAIEIIIVPKNSTFDKGGPAYIKITPTIRSRIVNAAYSRLGCPYTWGGNGPNSFDCSGLVKWCYAQVGISIPRTSSEQGTCGTKISISEAQPGDILWKPGHVGIYIGNNQYIHAPHSGEVVKISSISSGNFSYAVRVI